MISGKMEREVCQPVKSHRVCGLGAVRLTLRLQSQQSFSLTDADGEKLDGYNTVDFLGSYQLPVGKVSFAVENLLDKDYTTVGTARTYPVQSGVRRTGLIQL